MWSLAIKVNLHVSEFYWPIRLCIKIVEFDNKQKLNIIISRNPKKDVETNSMRIPKTPLLPQITPLTSYHPFYKLSSVTSLFKRSHFSLVFIFFFKGRGKLSISQDLSCLSFGQVVPEKLLCRWTNFIYISNINHILS